MGYDEPDFTQNLHLKKVVLYNLCSLVGSLSFSFCPRIIMGLGGRVSGLSSFCMVLVVCMCVSCRSGLVAESPMLIVVRSPETYEMKFLAFQKK